MAKAETNRLFLSVFALFWVWGGSVHADPVTVTWADLRADRPPSCETLIEGYQSPAKCSQQAASARLFSRQYEKCTPGRSDLNDQVVRIAGYAHPLEFEFRDVKTFLLIPPLRQDCSHPPPPLPDQVISVSFPDGLNVNADPVWVTGRLTVERGKTHLATARYALEAISVTQATIPEVAAGK